MKNVELSFSSGLKSLDELLQGIRPGDNVVWQADNIKDYMPFLTPFCRNACSDGKPLIYFRFAQHAPLLPENMWTECYNLDPDKGFEPFIFEIFTVIDKYGKGACYVFDCLSDLSVDWYSDRMVGNFFMLVCPYLYNYDTLAYFFLLRQWHTPLATDSIHGTAQVVLDIFNSDGKLYVLPVKVSDRSSPTLYMLHSWDDDNIFRPVTKSPIMSHILSSVPLPWIDFNIDRRDVWTERLIEAQKMFEKIQRVKKVPRKAETLKKQLIKMIVTRDELLFNLCDKYFDLSNIICIGKRMIGTGLIGVKAVGMLLGRIILKKEDPEWQNRLETHDSFYIGSDVFCSYVIQNDCWWDKRQLDHSNLDFDKINKIRERRLSGKFPQKIMEEFQEMLNYFGQSPIIVRSSSVLEDAYGSAFSGKYESIFCANQGTPEQRLDYFINAVRKVYASTMNKDALLYRARRGLLDKNEQMPVLVQRVSGTFFNGIYFPQVAGVAYSYNPFVWNSKIDPSEGVLRLVFGLGTHAVGHLGNDYTRIAAINAPLLRPEAAFDDVRKYTQKIVDILDLKTNRQASCSFEHAVELSPELPLDIFASKDENIEKKAKALNIKNIFPWILNFEKLLTKTTFLRDMREILQILEKAYNCPVDIEFSANFINDSDYRINLLQCRPFQISREITKVGGLSNIRGDDIILKTCGPIIGHSIAKPIDRIVYVSPSKYGAMSMSERYSVARLIGDITNSCGKDQNIILIGPGRWGTKMPALGIPVSFAEIKNASILCEIAAMHEALTPDISLGTHFFNDLVEMDILYMAVFPEKVGYILNENLIRSMPNKLGEIIPNSELWTESIYVIDPSNIQSASSVYPGKEGCYINVDSVRQQGFLFLSGT